MITVQQHRRFIIKAAIAAIVSQLGATAFAAVTSNTAGPVQQGQSDGGSGTFSLNNPATTISLSGQTALRNFTSGIAISLLQPGTSFTLHNGTNGAAVTYYAPIAGNTSVQLASRNFTLADVGVGATGFGNAAVTQRHSALRIEWHEQGSLDGFYDLINDQVGYTAAAGPLSNLGIRGPSLANPTWVNGSSFTTGTTLNGLSLNGASGPAAYNTYDPAVYELVSGRNLTGGQNRIQIAIGEPGPEDFAFAGTPSPFAKPGQAGFGQGNPSLSTAATPSGTGVAHARQSFLSENVANLSADKVDPQSTDGQHYQAGPWNSAGAGNIDSKQVAATAVTFSANPGTGLRRLNLSDAQWIQTTGRLQNGADFNNVTRVANTGQRLIPAINTGIDPTWAVGENDGGDTTTTAQADAQKRIGPSLRFSGKTSGTESRNAIAQSRMGIGTLSLAEARGAASSAPVRTLDVNFTDQTDPLTAGGQIDYSKFVHLDFDSFVTFTYKAILISHYNTVKAPNPAALAAYKSAHPGLTDAEAWALLPSFNPSNLNDPTAAGIKGDSRGDVAAFISNVSNSLATAAQGLTASSVANPADGLLVAGYFPPGLLNYSRTVDGGPLTPNNLNAQQQQLQLDIRDNYPTIFTTDGSFGSGSQTIGSGSTYGALGTASATVGSIPITAKDAAGNVVANGVFDAPRGNWLFGNFNQDGRRDLASVKEAVNVALSLHHADAAGGGGNSDIFSGIANGTVIPSLAGTPQWTVSANTKGDLIVLGDFNGDGAFDGKDIQSLARGASLADSAGAEHLTTLSGPSFADQARNPNAVLRKNAALDFALAQTSSLSDPDQIFLRRTAESPEAQANDAANNYLNAFNKLDVNRDGKVDLADALTVDKFIGQNYHNLEQQLAATIDIGGVVRPISLVDVELNDNGLIDQSDLTLVNGGILALAGNETWSGTIEKTGGGSIIFARPVGSISVAECAVFKISAGAFTAGGAVDPFSDSALPDRHLKIVNNGELNISAGDKKASSVEGTGVVRVGEEGEVASLTVNRVITGTLRIGNGGTVSVRAGGSAGAANRVSSLLIAGAAGDWLGVLDLADNDLIVQASPSTRFSVLEQVTSQLASGRNSGAGPWTGQGIRSSAAAESSLTGLAVILNDAGNGSALYSEFDGAAVNVNSILVKYTWDGDADLNGAVDADDYFRIDSGFASSGALAGYRNGDFDYSGAIDADDYFRIDSSFAGQTGVPQNGITVVAVPEPGEALLAAAGAIGLRRRRRRC